MIHPQNEATSNLSIFSFVFFMLKDFKLLVLIFEAKSSSKLIYFSWLFFCTKMSSEDRMKRMLENQRKREEAMKEKELKKRQEEEEKKKKTEDALKNINISTDNTSLVKNRKSCPYTILDRI